MAPGKGKTRRDPAEEWERLLIVDEHGRPKNLLANVHAILAGSPEWAGCFALNEARGEIDMLHPAPHLEHDEGTAWTVRPWSDHDDTLAAIWLQRRYRIAAKPDAVMMAVAAIANERRYNPLTKAISSVVWDGVPRLESWPVRYCGAEDTPFVRAVGAAWLRGAIARAFSPGIKFDTALILEGAQGAGKSSVFTILGGAYFTDELGDLKDKDTKLTIGRAWIVEIAELSALNRHEVEQVKMFLSKSFDNYRPVWARRPVDVPRRCAFGGSTNRSDYLRDETGGRRFWPVKVGTVDLEALARDRDQLLAEALVGWRKLGKEGILLPVELRATQREEAEQRRQVDAWEEPVREYLTNKSSVSIGDVLEDALDLKKDRWGRSEQMRLASVLVALGWARRRVAVGDKWVWRYTPVSAQPPTSQPQTPNTSCIPNIPNFPTSVGGVRFTSNGDPASSSEVGKVGKVGNNKENIEDSGLPDLDSKSSKVEKVGKSAIWDATYSAHLQRMPGQIGEAVALTTAELGPRPEDEVPDV